MDSIDRQDIATIMDALGRRARAASAIVATAPAEARDKALRVAANTLRARTADILAANALDMDAATEKGLSGAMLDRLMLNPARVEAMAKGLEEIADRPDPLGAVLERWERPNGLRFEKVRVPLGVIAIIFESRPNVTADAGGLCLKSGNAAILRGGSESFHSGRAILAALHAGLDAAGLPRDAIQAPPTTDRAAVGELLTMTRWIDVVIPRGGKSLTGRVAAESRVPVIYHLDGICHVYLDKDAEADKARRVTLNAKMRRTGICGAAETLLVHKDVATTLLPPILDDLIQAGCEVRGDDGVQALDARVKPATDEDWDTEYLDAILSVKLVGSVDEAIDHIGRHGSHHTDSIVTENAATAERFLTRVDSGIVLHNASTQFADGGEFGFGAEIGISTGKLHARGPVGAEQLTSYKYVVRGDGHTRP
ncbi:glutamate-5-semialdehyde dehydrogenase [Niveispirillum cyanobacteriorum]|uniref:Gamma-glutamyl phosphate reductase n=1 Tax=Niveispirillum cyanobacteriorum TaxID=1612173 RepID=A0A2K9N954_9PROT|nr:glutamate-5-semialdehyde dehydrogenase [Niveispirillum cyanobacteriorum]AUN29609.1 glutamate-5-semialdehyde dehydrogenase [Niveispirillum cyanobacteriorum]GGE62752.1 gamma-glutamyl phosphate reductase [Niveispirillum cyanobacteriorum]